MSNSSYVSLVVQVAFSKSRTPLICLNLLKASSVVRDPTLTFRHGLGDWWAHCCPCRICKNIMLAFPSTFPTMLYLTARRPRPNRACRSSEIAQQAKPVLCYSYAKDENLKKATEDGKISARDDFKLRVRVLPGEYGWDVTGVRKIRQSVLTRLDLLYWSTPQRECST